jgi:penicillin amidase
MNDVRAKNVQRAVRVERDEAGVPHILAGSWLDALYGLGYMHALDRGTQLWFSRAVAGGRAAEQIADKQELFETDSFFRRIGLHLNVHAEAARLDDHTRKQLLVYCAGVNDGIKAKGRSLPMWAAGFHPQPWDLASVILVGRLLSFGGLAVSQYQNERLLIELIHAKANDAALSEMFEPRLDHVDFDLVRRVNISNRLSDEALEVLVDLPRLAGSNAWAVGPERSATGNALLAADPHLEVNRLPAIWYEAVLRWDDHYVMGASLPGFPLFAVGRTPPLAWGVTYMKGDTIDFFVEECRPGGTTGWQYRRPEGWHDFRIRDEIVYRKGSDPVALRVCENELGTLDMDPQPHQGKYYLSIAWVGRHLEARTAVSTWLELVMADSVSSAMDLVADCTQPTLCFVLADRAGHIGLQGCGAIPRRRNQCAGLGPVPAWEPEHHWQGWLTVDLLPSLYDPPEGFVATANEEVNPPGGPLIVTQTVNDYRLRRIRQRLGELPAATVQDMQQLQYDVVSTQAAELLALILPNLPDGPLKEKLAAWDCSYSPESETAALFQHLYINLMMELLGNEKGIGWRRMVFLCSRAGYSSMVLTAADRLWQKNESWWWHGRHKGDLIRSAAERVNVNSATRWAEINNFRFTNRFFSGRRVGRLFGYNSRPIPMPGCHATPFQGHVVQTATRTSTFAPSYHFVTDLGTDEAWTNLPGGPSENRFSKYYRSDLPLWLTGEYKRLASGLR